MSLLPQITPMSRAGPPQPNLPHRISHADFPSWFVQLVLYNAQLDLFSNVLFEFQQNLAGDIDWTYNVQPIDANAYDETNDYVRFAFELLYVFSILKTIYDEASEGYKCFVATGRPLAYFSDGWNYLDVLSLVVSTTTIVLWIVITMLAENSFDMSLMYQAYEPWKGRYVCMHGRHSFFNSDRSSVGGTRAVRHILFTLAPSGFRHDVPVETTQRRVCHDVDGRTMPCHDMTRERGRRRRPCSTLGQGRLVMQLPEWERIFSDFGTLKKIGTYQSVYISLAGINIFFFLLRILKQLHFQPQVRECCVGVRGCGDVRVLCRVSLSAIALCVHTSQPRSARR